ncbi:hypothetical protein C9I98_06340 [Photobacterium sanctipauli]|uniref:Uncharacterized protein n=2 Tax=Photobacterium sanctipauli TaxID=1342794 RepID=A0A2T3NW29_9GAMM|nr:hypothetical protein [Photobacterium sanctipauli]PSW20465.1 hypothetical protein C9I98_06340 [Photobacterium sanctipauli]
MVRYNKKLPVIGALLGLAVAGGAQASSKYLLPPVQTNDMFALEKDCDCVLRITPDKYISVEIKEDDIIYAIKKDTYDELEDISFGSKAIVALDDGTLLFTVGDGVTMGDDNDFDSRSYVMKRNPYGKLSVLLSNYDILNLTYETASSLEGLVQGGDGYFYTGDDISDSIIRIDPYSGYAKIFIEQEDIDKLGEDFQFDVQPAMAADNRYLYLASDDSPNLVFKVDYTFGKPEIFAAGPNVDPFNLSKENYIYLVNDYKNPPRGYDSYYGLKGYDYPKKPTNISGKFKINIDKYKYYNHEYSYSHTISTDPLQWDASPYDVAAAIKKAIGVKVEVTGVGTIGKPWEFNLPDGFKFTGVTEYYLEGASIETISNNSTGGDDKEAIESQNHIEALSTSKKYGKLSVRFEARITSGSDSETEDLGTISWYVGDSPAKIKELLVKYTHLTEKDVHVSGTGSSYNPWVFSFKGGFENTRIALKNGSYGHDDTIDSDYILVGTIQNARAFDDPDGFMTRKYNGVITVQDDSNGHFIYDISLLGEVSKVLSEWDFVSLNKGSVDIEGGIAYDQDKNLFISSHGDSDSNDFGKDQDASIFKYSKNGSLSIWIDAEDIAKVTYGDEGSIEVEGIAFERKRQSKSNSRYKPEPSPSPSFPSSWF